jgi:uncharacterized protein
VRVLLDSSVLIAACISRSGTCANLLEDVLIGHEWVISQLILDEVARKLREKFHYSRNDIAEIVAPASAAARMEEPVDIPAGSCRDANDLPVLSTAVAGPVELLITGDKDLLQLRTFRGIAIISPSEFWKHVAVKGS